MFLILVVCLMKFLEMTSDLVQRRGASAAKSTSDSTSSSSSGVSSSSNGSNSRVGRAGCNPIAGKENRAINGHLRNYFSETAALKNGYKHQLNRGMTESTHTHHKAKPSGPTRNRQPYEHHNQHIRLQQHELASAAHAELTDSGLRDNVQIVLNNLHRNAFYAGVAAAQQQQHIQQPTKHRQRILHRKRLCSLNAMLSSPESDCNSNPHPSGIVGGSSTGIGSLLNCSVASSTHDFTHDNSDYQWFLDYGYRDGGVTHQSILSSLSASYTGIGELSYYEDLAKNIDANLAEVDMESFTFRPVDNQTADRMAPLTTAAAVAAATAAAAAAQSRHIELDNSFCASEQLFSPVKETNTLSVDSLDLDGFGDGDDIILTCQANKDNYTIAFEGSTIYSEESYYGGNAQSAQRPNTGGRIDEIIRRKALEVSMSHSDTGFTTWSKLKKTTTQSQSQLQRYPSGNNNTTATTCPTAASTTHATPITRHAVHCPAVRKSTSLPDLHSQRSSCHNQRRTDHQADGSPLNAAHSRSTVDSYGGSSTQQKLRQLLPNASASSSLSAASCASPAQLQHSGSSCHSGRTAAGSEHAYDAVDNAVHQQQEQPQPAFNLVKLFIKQKSSSSDTCMDVSSGCWPSNESASSSQEQQQQQQQTSQRHRKKSMHDSGKGSALSRHDEDLESGDFQYDSLDVAAAAVAPMKAKPLHREVFESPNRRPTNKHLANVNNNNSMERDSLKDTNSSSLTDDTSDNITQVFAAGISDASSASDDERKMRLKQKHAVLMSRSIQTSMRLSQTSIAVGTSIGSRVKVVPPSFLAQLSQNSTKLGESQSAPVYVIYPNYALPDLAFVNHSDVILSPLSYTKSGMSPPASLQGATGPSQSTSSHTPKNRSALAGQQRRRPVSLLDCDAMVRNKDYAHIDDWQSLATLLPAEYRNLLRHIPAVNEAIQTAPSQKPLFSMTPPLLRRSQMAGNCDCAQYTPIQRQASTASANSSGSVSSEQRGTGGSNSSGYRGSSTILTESDAECTTGSDPMRNMYVYQYENNSHMADAERPPSGRATPARGILRRMNSKTRSSSAKRNSMFEEATAGRTSTGRPQMDKRLSLQEQPYYNEQNHYIIEDYLAELDEQSNADQQNSPDHQQQHRLNTSRVYSPTDAGAPTTSPAALKELRAASSSAEIKQAATDETYYAEVATILKSIEKTTELYDRQKLRTQVSRALSKQQSAIAAAKRVSFDGASATTVPVKIDANATLREPINKQQHHYRLSAPVNSTVAGVNNNQTQHLHGTAIKEFTTPPNSPNISVAQLRLVQKQLRSADQEKQDKIQSNRFKRLQIQWELLSNEAQALQDEFSTNDACGADGKETRSGGSTPTSAASVRSRIPRPVSFPATKTTVCPNTANPVKQLQSPSRIVPPKRYGSAPSSGHSATSPAPAIRSRTPNRLNTTPKRAVPAPRTASARTSR